MDTLWASQWFLVMCELMDEHPNERPLRVGYPYKADSAGGRAVHVVPVQYWHERAVPVDMVLTREFRCCPHVTFHRVVFL